MLMSTYYSKLFCFCLLFSAFASNALAQDVRITGTNVFTYTHNNNHPKQHGNQYFYAENSNSDNVYLYNGRAGSLRMTYSTLDFLKESRRGRIGFKISVVDGEADTVFGHGSVDTNFVSDAYLIIPITYKNKKRILDYGSFISPMGYEKLQMDNLVSRSYQYQFTQPFIFEGTRISLGKNTDFYFLEQFDGILNYGSIDYGPPYAAVIHHNQSLSPEKNLSLTGLWGRVAYSYGYNYDGPAFPYSPYGGYDTSLASGEVGMLNVVYRQQKDEKTQWVIDATLNNQKTGGASQDDTTQTRTAIGAYYLKTQNNGDLLTLRGEYAEPGKDTRFKEVRSLTAAYQFKKPLISHILHATTILELRLDKANAPMFYHGKSRTRKDQATLAISQIVKF
jgi:Putative beta-barrel porin-2, OmpL-like. bbp2